MAIIETQPGVLPTRNFWTVIIRSAVNLLSRHAEHRRKRRALAQLRGLDTRTLKDIAIDRSELGSVVHGDPRGRRRAYRGN